VPQITYLLSVLPNTSTISCDYLNLSVENEYVGDVTISTQVIKYMYKDKEVNKKVKNIFSSMCDVRLSLTFTSLNFDNYLTYCVPELL
jgi:hypothetical protein